MADALRHRLYRLADWRAKALAATTDLSGKTPGALIEALVAAPVLSTDTAAEVTGASKAGVRRNLAVLQARGLVSEITGQGRAGSGSGGRRGRGRGVKRGTGFAGGEGD